MDESMSPGKRLNGGDTGREAAESYGCEKGGGDGGGVERVYLDPLAVSVNRIVLQNSALKSLVCEMLATFTLPSNAEHFDKLGTRWKEVVASWSRSFRRNNGQV